MMNNKSEELDYDYATFIGERTVSLMSPLGIARRRIHSQIDL